MRSMLFDRHLEFQVHRRVFVYGFPLPQCYSALRLSLVPFFGRGACELSDVQLAFLSHESPIDGRYFSCRESKCLMM